ncbi:2Fe-2S iron-sulfur cluster-binding protein [Halomarina litorea]|uniref:2Fe-2S iron-sulfur cluster-binding protein n=1 Tax=Halomarina litorea TaxID=2961595 RepID=UPI0020C2C58C|nr:2Fe-2S iron-sulfur cluster-binding protein [Halomarina sp. BCD28]
MPTYDVTIDWETGGTAALAVDDDEYVLDAAEAAGLDLPYSCREGNCTTCVGELVEGEVDQSEGMALEPDQREDGYALLCVSYPRSDCRVRAGEGLQEEALGLDLF